MVSNVQGNIMHSNITQHKQKELQVWHLHFASSVNELSTKVAIHQKSRNVLVVQTALRKNWFQKWQH